MTADPKDKIPYELADSNTKKQQDLSLTEEAGEKKFSPLVEKALEAVTKLGRRTLH